MIVSCSIGHGLAVGDVLLQPAHQPFVGDAHLAAQAGQFDGGRVEHLALVRDGARDGIHDADRVGQAECQPADARVLRLHLLEGLLQLAARDQRGLDIQHVGGIQHPAVSGEVHLLADVVRAADGQVVQREQLARFGRFLLAGAGQFEAGGRLKLARQSLRGAEVAVGGQAFEHLGIFDDVESLAVHSG